MRAGRFFVGCDVDDKNFEDTMKMIGGTVAITRCEYSPLRLGFDVQGICAAFDDLTTGEMIPEYRAQISWREDQAGTRTYSVKWKRQP